MVVHYVYLELTRRLDAEVRGESVDVLVHSRAVAATEGHVGLGEDLDPVRLVDELGLDIGRFYGSGLRGGIADARGS
ncbi:MAG: hypothetical protein HC927_04485 [Deltaproteobacteria bacterium]|nr:hypothetical protein [Deltaproteobacteria bacterium]